MVKHRNSIPKAHFKKHWQKYVKTDFNKAMKKKKRRNLRSNKLNNFEVNKLARNNILKPVVHNPTKMYNLKIRLGRGFSIDELEGSNISKNIASALGVSVDKRRRGYSLKKISNIKRLNDYFEKIEVTTMKKESDKKLFNEKEPFLKFLEKKIKKKFLVKNEVNLENFESRDKSSLTAIENLRSLD